MIIERLPTPIFDFFITLAGNEKVKFAIEVKEISTFDRHIRELSSKLKIYRDNGMINIPALIFKVNESNETGLVDFFVVPSASGKLLIRQNFHFKKLTPKNIDNFVEKIIKWWAGK